jgi:RNA recognition motif-containing protein
MAAGLPGKERNRGMEAKLYVGNLAYSTTSEDLRQLFAQAGTVSAADVIKDRDTGQSKGFAFVTMATPPEAQKAIAMLNSFAINGRPLTVSLAKPRENRENHGGPQGRLSAFSGGRTRAHKPRGGNRRY